MVCDAVICFFLIKKDEPPINGVLRCITQDITDGHGNVSRLPALHETGLVMSDQIRKDKSEARGKKAGEDLAITIGKCDWTPICQAREVAIWFGDERYDCTRP